ncbi:MAG: class I SAM-dependent methyltransferase [Pseudomonadota bacterium]|nr:class I SAM-dependent methyltransferase [Pseudomonadota bacterium]
MRSNSEPTTDYYQTNAGRYFQNTVHLDMAPLYDRFLGHLRPGARILDAGCGSGRDAKAFSDLGYVVRGFDASSSLVKLAEKHARVPVEVLRFQDLGYVAEFDGIWACASLLHVCMDELPDVLGRLARALDSNGIIYVSFKYGQGSREVDGRRFTDLDEATLMTLVKESRKLDIVETWISGDRRPDRQADRWLNALLATGEATCRNI